MCREIYIREVARVSGERVRWDADGVDGDWSVGVDTSVEVRS